MSDQTAMNEPLSGNGLSPFNSIPDCPRLTEDRPIPMPRRAKVDVEEALGEAARAIGSIPDEDEAQADIVAVLRQTGNAPKQRELLLRVLKAAGVLRAAETYTKIEEAARESAAAIVERAKAKGEQEAQQIRQEAERLRHYRSLDLQAVKEKEAELKRREEELLSEHRPMLALIEATIKAASMSEMERGHSYVAQTAILLAASIYGKHPVNYQPVEPVSNTRR